MTQPDQYFPATGVNAGTGFAAYSRKTQADYENDRRTAWTSTLGPLSGLCLLIQELPFMSGLGELGTAADGFLQQVLTGSQELANELCQLVSTAAGDTTPQSVIAGANAILDAAGANTFYNDIVSVGQAVAGISGNVVVDLINGIDAWLDDLMAFIGDPVGFGTGVVTGVISAIRIAGLDASKIISGTFADSFVPGLADTWTAIVSALGGIGSDLAAVEAALQNIPALNVFSDLGGVVTDAAAALQGAVDAAYQGLASAPTATENALAALANIGNQLTSFLGFVPGATSPPVSSVAGQTQAAAFNLANRAVTKPAYVGIDQSADAVFNWSQLAGASLPTISVTQGNSVIGVIGTPDAGIKEAIEFFGGYTGTISALYINVCQINTAALSGIQQIIQVNGSPTSFTLTFGSKTTSAITYSGITAATIQTALSALSSVGNSNVTVSGGNGIFVVTFINALSTSAQSAITGATSGGGSLSISNATYGQATRLWSSTNMMVSPGVGTGYGWNFANIPAAQYISSVQGGCYAVEMQVVGSGTYSIVGLNHAATPHPTAMPPSLGGTRTVVPQLFSASNSASSSSSGTSLTVAHPAVLGDTIILAAVEIYGGAAAVTNVTATAGGVSMTRLGFTQYVGSPSFSYLAVFALTGAFSGSTSVVATITGGTAGSRGLDMVTVSYPNVTGWGTLQSTGAQATATTFTQTVTGISTPTLVVQAVGGALAGAGSGISSVNQEIVNSTVVGSFSNASGLQDAYINGNVTMSGVFAATGPWIAMAVPLVGNAALNPVCPQVNSYYSAIGGDIQTTPGTSVASVAQRLNASDNCVMAAATIYSATAITSVAATLGGTAMTQCKLSTTVGATGTFGFNYLVVFGLVGTAGAGAFTGTPNVVVTVTGGSNISMTLKSNSYSNITSLGTAQTASGSTASANLTTTGVTTANLVFNAAICVGATPPYFISNTYEYLYDIPAGSAVGGYALIAADVYGVANPQFKDGLSVSGNWYSVAVPITVTGGYAPSALPAQITPNFNGNMPWFGLTAQAGVSQYNTAPHSPRMTEYDAPGAFVYTIPKWANFFDIVVLGGGGGGAAGGPPSVGGNPGTPGSYSMYTLSYAQLTNNGANTSVSGTVGGGGGGGSGSGGGAGTAGDTSSLTVPGYGTLSGAGGTFGGGTHAGNAGSPGPGPGNATYDDETYYGGATQPNGGGGGYAPGGAGAGGNGTPLIGWTAGGPGAPGAVWIVAYQ